MNSDGHQQLLKEVLHDNAVENLRQASLGKALASMRARRRIRHSLASAALLCIVATAGIPLAFKQTTPRSTRPAPVPARATQSTRPSLDIKDITDQELLALFPGQTVALIGSEGNQRFIVYDRPNRTTGIQ